MARRDDPDQQLVSFPLDSATVYRVAQSMNRANLSSRPEWLRKLITDHLDREEAECRHLAGDHPRTAPEYSGN